MLFPTLLALIGHPAPAVWTFQGRQVKFSSTSRTELLLNFTLRPGEDPVAAVRGCVQAMRAQDPTATYVYCAAYTPAAFGVLSGKLRLCYSVNLHWFGAAAGTPETLRFNLAGDDPRYPGGCPAPALPGSPPTS